MAKLKDQKTELTMNFELGASESTLTYYCDLAQCLSLVNRRLYEQAKNYWIEHVKVIFPTSANVADVTLSAIPDTWVTSNAHVKAHALWKQMRDKVLDDNPSVESKWADFKVYMNSVHQASGGASNILPRTGSMLGGFSNVATAGSEWKYSQFIAPQHEGEVQAPGGTGATVLPKDADEYDAHMLGANTGTANAWTSVGIIQGYYDTRARVVDAPEVPADIEDSWMITLMDTGSQEPELVESIDADNDQPPYAKELIVGGDSNFTNGVMKSYNFVSPYSPDAMSPGFKVPLGLLKIMIDQDIRDGGSGDKCYLQIKLASGNYKGVLATEVRQ